MAIPSFASRLICAFAVTAVALSPVWLGVEPAAAAQHSRAHAARRATKVRHNAHVRHVRRNKRNSRTGLLAVRAFHVQHRGGHWTPPPPESTEKPITTETPPPPPPVTIEPTTPPETKEEPKQLLGSGWEGFGGLALPGASWRPYASTSPFNTPVGGAATVAASQTYVEKALSWGSIGSLLAGTSGTSEDWSHPTYFAQSSDPLYTLHATEPWGPNELDGIKIPVPERARPAGGGDGHMAIVTPDGWEYDLWQAQAPPAGGGTLNFSWGGRTRIDGNGLGSGGTAAGFGNAAGMIRAPELIAGHINHALFIVLKCAAKGTGFGYGTTATSYGSSYVYPAKHGGSACSSTETTAVPLGAHFVLAMSEAQIQALAVPVWKKTILSALAEYGGYVGDTGGPGFAFMFESGSTYTARGLPDPMVAFAQANGVPTWNGAYVFNVANGVEWSRYLRVVAPPSA